MYGLLQFFCNKIFYKPAYRRVLGRREQRHGDGVSIRLFQNISLPHQFRNCLQVVFAEFGAVSPGNIAKDIDHIVITVKIVVITLRRGQIIYKVNQVSFTAVYGTVAKEIII